jgi:hypothetical protein
MENRQMETSTSSQHAILVNVIVKASSVEEAEQQVVKRMDRWLVETACDFVNEPYEEGTLLAWNFYEPMVINGR